MAEGKSSGPVVVGPPLETAKVELQHLLRFGLATKPDAVALYTPAGEPDWTFASLDAASDGVARGYLRLGVKKGDRAASLLPNCVELMIHYIACAKIGLALTPMNYRYTPPEMDHALDLSRSTVLVAHVGQRKDDLARLTVRPPLGTVAVGGRDDENVAHFSDLMKEEGPPVVLHPEADGDAPAIVFFTSGSTGKPKGVTHSYDTYGYCLASFIQALHVTEKDIIMPCSSLSHAAGTAYSLGGLAVGAPAVIAPNGTADVVLPLFRSVRPTIAFFLPSFLLMLVRDARAEREDFASLRLLQSGGDKVARLLQKECFELSGLYVTEIMGMSECAPITIHAELERDDKRGSIGKVTPGLSICIRDVATRREVPLGEDGRMWIKGKLVMTGYWNNPGVTSDTIRDGWMDTGDVVHADADGYIWFSGRQKQIIVHDGSNISPLEVEDVLMTHAAVDQAGVVGVPDVVHGENVKAYITLKEGIAAAPSELELIEHCRVQIGYKSPESIEILPSMPLNPTGKVDRAALKGQSASPMPAMVQTVARRWMRGVLQRRASEEARRRSSMVETDAILPELLQLLEEDGYEDD